MRLYTRTGATALDDPEFGHFDADENGAFDLPEELSDRLHGFHLGGRPMWETDVERQRRLIHEEMERRKDPATLLSAVEQIMQAAKASAAMSAVAAEDAEPTEPAAPVEPVGPAEPTELTELTELTEEAAPAKPAKATKATRSRKVTSGE